MMALIHDVGKIGIPDAVINNPGRLTPEEFDVIKTHPVIGSQILSTRTKTIVCAVSNAHPRPYDCAFERPVRRADSDHTEIV